MAQTGTDLDRGPDWWKETGRNQSFTSDDLAVSKVSVLVFARCQIVSFSVSVCLLFCVCVREFFMSLVWGKGVGAGDWLGVS